MTPENRFDKWWADPEYSFSTDCPSDVWIAKQAYLAATEDAARIAEEQGLKDKGALGEYCFEIAAAIRVY